MIEEKIKSIIIFAVEQIFHIGIKPDSIEITKPAKKEHGDFATNIAFKIAKEVKKPPMEVAIELANNLINQSGIEKTEAVNGFVNFFLSKEAYIQKLGEIISQKEKFGEVDTFKNKKIQVEFISANPTGPLTLGNSRGGFPGDVLANVFAKAGAKVEREYYLNNGGNQVKILGESLLVAAGLLKKEEDIYRGDYVDKWVKEHKKEIEKYKDDPFELGRLAASDIVNEYIKPATDNMKIHFNQWFSEYDLIKDNAIEKTINRLKDKDLVYEKDGATWFKATEFGDEKDRVMVKSDGLYTYFAGDSAYHWNKFADRKFDKVIDIWGADHHGDVLRVLGAADALGFNGKLDIILCQFVRLIKEGKEVRMSKRKGNYITIDDLLELIGGSVEEASDVARFFFLMRSFNTHMDFDLDLAREHSEKNPVFYVKYAYARLSGILRNAKELKLPKADLSKLDAEQELDLIDKLSELPQIVQSIVSMEEYPVHYLTYYAFDIAKAFHAFYDKCRVIDENDLEMTSARLKLVEATKIVLGIVMGDLIGIDTPERM
jgi:arginyl-tRNA synthetase